MLGQVYQFFQTTGGGGGNTGNKGQLNTGAQGINQNVVYYILSNPALKKDFESGDPKRRAAAVSKGSVAFNKWFGENYSEETKGSVVDGPYGRVLMKKAPPGKTPAEETPAEGQSAPPAGYQMAGIPGGPAAAQATSTATSGNTFILGGGYKIDPDSGAVVPDPDYVPPGPTPTPDPGPTDVPKSIGKEGEGGVAFNPGEWARKAGSLAGPSMLGPLAGAALGALGGLGKDPDFDRLQESKRWRHEFQQNFSRVSRDARDDPFSGSFYRNANRSMLSAANMMQEQDAQLQERQRLSGGQLFAGGRQRSIAASAPGVYAQQGNLLNRAYDIRDKAMNAENRFTNLNTDKEQQLFEFQVATGTHEEYGKGINLVNRVASGALAGFGEGLDIAGSLFDMNVTKKIAEKGMDTYEKISDGGFSTTGVPGTTGAIGANTPGLGPVTAPPPSPQGPMSMNQAWNQGNWMPQQGRVGYTDPGTPYPSRVPNPGVVGGGGAAPPMLPPGVMDNYQLGALPQMGDLNTEAGVQNETRVFPPALQELNTVPGKFASGFGQLALHAGNYLSNRNSEDGVAPFAKDVSNVAGTVGGAIGDAGAWTGNAAADAGVWGFNAAGSAGGWGLQAGADAGGFLWDQFKKGRKRIGI